jgi:beta-N-acetylhexosaminidase
MVGMPLTYVDEATTAHLTGGGRALILFSGNVANRDQLRSLASDAACAANAPVLIAVDQEFGPVDRLGDLITPLPSAPEAADSSPDEVEAIGRSLGVELLGLGLNTNLAPVADVVRGPNPVLAGRHLGEDPGLVAELVAAFVTGMGDTGVVAAVKHFPGLGLATADPHDAATRIDAPASELAAIDLVPFRAAVAAAVPAVMVSHAVYSALDPDRPASLAPAVYRMLRDDLGFDGLVLTDAVNMAAVIDGRSPGEVVVAALAAGADLVINPDWSQTEPIVAAVVAAVERGDLPAARLVEAARRVERTAATTPLVECRAR